ncbi:CidA/LrgA family holin-like protein [Bacillus sp. AFS055030]|uniref:CidA/LrgA family protein n=1 Tax=Bacillus sp. AFS055030 TaxID=2033507 RepID=UPI0015D47F8E|nr:CidA/LrgA family holin-like protein [Bacillus sp. AFS055030]
MRFVQLIVQISFLYLLFFIGNIIQKQFHLMIPGSIIGMLLLFCLLFIPLFKEKWVRDGSNFLSKHLTLLFIPATVGIMNYSSILNVHGLISILIVLVSTAVVFSLTASISSYLTSRAHKKQSNDVLVGRDTNEGH